jgi:hypothetical protein
MSQIHPEYLPTGSLSGYTLEIDNYVGFPPHTFMTITSPDVYIRRYGFAPQTSPSTKGPGKIYNEIDHRITVQSTAIKLTDEQYSRLAKFINYSIDHPPYYDATQGMECTTWVYTAINETFDINLVNPKWSPSPTTQFILYDFLKTLAWNPYVNTDVLTLEKIVDLPGRALMDAWRDLGKFSNHLLNTVSPLPDATPRTLPNYIQSVRNGFALGMALDPVVLDLSGSGAFSGPLYASQTYFDLQGTGFQIRTSWADPRAGLLVRPNADGSVTGIQNLFGNATTSGFTMLKAWDVNADGVLNAKDGAAFTSLKIWQDANGNGIADAGELRSLAQWNIVSLSLKTSPAQINQYGNAITETAVFTRGDGTVGKAADVWLQTDPLDSRYVGSYTLNPAALLLPNLRGYGRLPDLYVAMSQDDTLLQMVRGLANTPLAGAATFDAQVRGILYRWAGVDKVDPKSRGAYVDARDLMVLEKVNGQPYVAPNGGANPMASAPGKVLEENFANFLAAAKARLLAQGPLASSLPGVAFRYATDQLTGEGVGSFAPAVTALAKAAPTDHAAAVAYWKSLGSFLTSLAGDLNVSQPQIDSVLRSNTAFQTAVIAAHLPMSLLGIARLHDIAPTQDKNGAHIFTVNGDNVIGAVVQGVADGRPNILHGSWDLSQAAISGISELDADRDVTMTAGQLQGLQRLVNATVTNPVTISASTAGTYSLAAHEVTGQFHLDARGTDADVTLIGNNQAGQILRAGAGHDTLIAGNAGAVLFDGAGVSTLQGGTGADEFHSYSNTAGSRIIGGGGADTLVMEGTTIYNVNISGVGTLKAPSEMRMTADQLQGFTNLIDTIPDAPNRIFARTGGTYDLSKKHLTGVFELDASETTGVTMLTLGNQGQVARLGPGGGSAIGGSGADTLSDGAGKSFLFGNDGNDRIVLNYATPGSLVYGGNGADTLDARPVYDITGVTLNGIETIEAGASLKLTGAQFSLVPTIKAAPGGTSLILTDLPIQSADLTAKHFGNQVTLDLSAVTGNVTIHNGPEKDTLILPTHGTATLFGDKADFKDDFISGFGAGDYFNIGGIPNGPGTSFAFTQNPDHTSGTLTIHALQQPDTTIQMAGSFEPSLFHTKSNGLGGIIIGYGLG